MSERTKKILFAVIFLLISIGMGYFVYFLLFKAPTVTPPTPVPPAGLNGQLPSAGNGSPATSTIPTPGNLPPGGVIPNAPQPTTPTAPVNTQVLNPGVSQAVVPSPNGDGARYYNPADGRFYHVNADGTITALSDKQFFNVQNVSWGNTSNQAIMTFPDGSNLFYNFAQQEQVNLPNYWQNFNFAPNDTTVAAESIGQDPNNRYLITTNPDGTEAKAIAALGDNADKVVVDWSPSSQIVGYAFTGNPQEGSQQQVLFVGQHQENFPSIIAPGQGFLANWSPTGKQILFSTWQPQDDNKPTLWIASGQASTMGADRKNLQLHTWADKCAWQNETTLFCGVPQNMPADAGVMRSQFINLPDDVYKIDLLAGTAVKITTPDQNHPVRSPIVNKDGTKFIFSDTQTGALYSYNIH